MNPTLSPGQAGLIALGHIVAVARADTAAESFVVGLTIFCVLLVLQTPLAPFASRMTPFLFLAGLTLLFGGLGPGQRVVAVGPFHWSAEALSGAALAGFRLLLIGGVTVWLGLSLGTTRLLASTLKLGARVKRLGLDVTPILLSLALAVRLLPLLHEEAGRIRLAWRARGAALLGRGPKGLVVSTMGLAVPLIASSLRRAGALADAIQLRFGADGRDGAALFSAAEGEEAPRLGSIRAVAAIAIAWSAVFISVDQWVG